MFIVSQFNFNNLLLTKSHLIIGLIDFFIN